jgi:soluble cytochrome b562
MPYSRKATMQDVEDYAGFKKLSIPLDDARKLVEAGKVTYVATNFEDSEEYTKLMADGQTIGYWPGC